MSINRDTLVKIAYIAMGVVAVWLLLRFLLPWLAPFILALLTARLIEPGVKGMRDKWRVKRSFAAFFFSSLFLGAVASVLALMVTVLISEAGNFVKSLPEFTLQMGNSIKNLENALYRFIASAPLETQDLVKNIIGNIYDTIYALPAQLSTYVLNFAAAVASATPKILIFVLTYMISVYFTSGAYPDVIAFIGKQIPARLKGRASAVKADGFSALCKWCKAQLKLIGVTFVALTIALAMLRIPNSFLIALLISLIDALPVLGTGTVLIPWALINLAGGNTTLSMGLLLTYAVISLLRSFLEPRLVGGQLGLHPLATLIAMYVGFCTTGVIGMLLFPLALVLAKEICDKGAITLWK